MRDGVRMVARHCRRRVLPAPAAADAAPFSASFGSVLYETADDKSENMSCGVRTASLTTGGDSPNQPLMAGRER